MSTDTAWESWGRQDPYFAVITDPRFRRDRMNDEARREFFQSGESHVDGVLQTVRRRVDPDFSPQRILEFGCGVGRVLCAFARVAEEVVGLDVSPSMLKEARRNCDEQGLGNVKLVLSDDSLGALDGRFDLIHSCIVFQHIPTERGRALFAGLLKYLRPGGVAALQLTYSKISFAATHGIAPVSCATAVAAPPTPTRPAGDPEIQMNPYNLNEILFLLQMRGVQRLHMEFSDHGGELGVFLFFSITGEEIHA